jgi:hypothetical protein
MELQGHAALSLNLNILNIYAGVTPVAVPLLGVAAADL